MRAAVSRNIEIFMLKVPWTLGYIVLGHFRITKFSKGKTIAQGIIFTDTLVRFF